MAYFADPKRGLDFMVSLRWADGKVTCPHCQSEKVSFLSTRSKWKCMACHKQFSAKVGTLFEDSALGYDKWFPAMWLIVNAKNGISSYEISRALGVTQKTAWFMLQRIRLAMQTGTFEKLNGDVEVDETYIGGLAKNMHMKKRLKRITGTGSLNKVAVMGFLERGGRARTAMLKEPTREIMDPLVRQNIKEGSQSYRMSTRAISGSRTSTPINS
jgi:transposase-like protein